MPESRARERIGRVLHGLACRIGGHLWYESFRYAPQGFASTHYVVIDRCYVCRLERKRTEPYDTEPLEGDGGG